MDALPSLAAPGLRIARASDRAAIGAFLSRLSTSTIQARYLSSWSSLAGPRADQETQRLLDGDAARHVVVVAVDGTEIRGVGEFVVEDTPAEAELALVVEDSFQRRGIGQLLFRRLARLARERGISALTGDFGFANQRVRRLLHSTRLPLREQLGYGVVRFRLGLESSGPD